MLQGMINLENDDFKVLNTVHDEVWAQGLPCMLDCFKRAMLGLPAWCSDLVLDVEVTEGPRYLK